MRRCGETMKAGRDLAMWRKMRFQHSGILDNTQFVAICDGLLCTKQENYDKIKAIFLMCVRKK